MNKFRQISAFAAAMVCSVANAQQLLCTAVTRGSDGSFFDINGDLQTVDADCGSTVLWSVKYFIDYISHNAMASMYVTPDCRFNYDLEAVAGYNEAVFSGPWDDAFQAVKVPVGYKLTLFENADYTGATEELIG